jgi:hypothetical protein
MTTSSVPSATPSVRNYKYYDFVMAGFVCVLLCANLIGVRKVVGIAGVEFGAGNLFFPLSYLFGDLLTEVYGYKRSRRVVWAGFAALAFMSGMAAVIVALPPGASFHDQDKIEWAFGSAWRICLGSLLGYFCGEFTNSFVLAKLKVLTNGRMLWLRTIGSTVVGEAVDTVIFYPIALRGIYNDDALLVRVMIANYCIKVGWEIVATPLTYFVVTTMKRIEGEDYFDRDTQFTPFSLKT